MSEHIPISIPDELLDAFRSDSVVPFIGSGLSSAAGYPSWHTLLQHLGNRFLAPQKLVFYNSLDPLQMGQYLYDDRGKGVILGTIRKKLSRSIATSEIHRILVTLPVKAFITTNWDTLIEDHYKHTFNSAPNVIVDDKDIALASDATMVMKIHGDIGNSSSIVFAEDDYYDFLMQRPLMQRFLQVIIATSTILFIGYSFNDFDFKLLFHQVKKILGDLRRRAFIYIPNGDQAVCEYLRTRGLVPFTTLGENVTAATTAFLEALRAEVSVSAVETLDRLRIMHRENQRILARGICAELRNMSNLGPLATPDSISDPTLFNSPDRTKAELECAMTWRRILELPDTRAKVIVCLDPKWIASHYNSQHALKRLKTFRENLKKYHHKLEVVDVNNPVFVNMDIYDREVCMEGQKYGADQSHLVVHHQSGEIDDRIRRFDTLFADIQKQNELASSSIIGNPHDQYTYILRRVDDAIATCEPNQVTRAVDLVGVCWAFTTTCNMSCPICFSFKEACIDTVNMVRRKQVIDSLHHFGIRKVSFGGGEPLLCKDSLLSCVIYAKGRGMKTALCTNGKLLDEALCQELTGFLDELTLPLDGPDPETHAAHRGDESHFQTVLDNIRRAKRYGITVDISTVLTSVNRHNIMDMLDLLRNLSILKWKVFQFYPLADAVKNKDKFCLSETDFSQIREKLIQKRGSLEIDFRSDCPTMMQSYLNLSPSGNILFVDNGCYCDLGSITGQSDLVSLLVREGFNFDYHKERHRRD